MDELPIKMLISHIYASLPQGNKWILKDAVFRRTHLGMKI
jgi:hypothetical protein